MFVLLSSEEGFLEVLSPISVVIIRLLILLNCGQKDLKIHDWLDQPGYTTEMMDLGKNLSRVGILLLRKRKCSVVSTLPYTFINSTETCILSPI